MPGRPRWRELGRNHRLRDYCGHPCHARSSTANTYSMEPHELALRGIATNYGWTWYRMRRLIDSHLACQGASMAQLRLLALLAEQPRRSTDIASFFDQAPRTVTQAIDALEQNGLVSRSPAADDRRSKLVQITDAGRVTLGLAMPLYDDIVGQTFGSLTADELEGLNAAVKHLNRLVDHLESKSSVTATRAPAAKARAHG